MNLENLLKIYRIENRTVIKSPAARVIGKKKGEK